MDNPGSSSKYDSSRINRKIIFGVSISAATIVFLFIFLQFHVYQWPEWTGFRGGIVSSRSTETRINDKVKVTKTETIQSGKTLWDWLGVLVIPVSLAATGLWFQAAQQKRAAKQLEQDKRIAEDNLLEEILQNYIDRLADILIDKFADTSSDSVREAAIDVIRAKTLSILRRLGEDGERKGRIVRFLYDSELITKFSLLKDADLRRVMLDEVDLSKCDFSGANLSSASFSFSTLNGAKFHSAILRHATLNNADLTDSDLESAELCFAKLDRANLKKATLKNTDLRDVDLSNVQKLTQPQVELAKLCNTKLPDNWVSPEPEKNCGVAESVYD